MRRILGQIAMMVAMIVVSALGAGLTVQAVHGFFRWLMSL